MPRKRQQVGGRTAKSNARKKARRKEGVGTAVGKKEDGAPVPPHAAED